MATKTHLELIDFINQANFYRYQEDKEGVAIKNPPVRNRLDRALDRMLIQITKVKAFIDCEDTYNDRKKEIPFEYAIVDEKTKAYLLNEKGGYLHTPESGKEIIKKERAAIKLLNDTVIEFEPHIIEDIYVPELTEQQAAAFRGIVISEKYEIPEPKWLSNGGTTEQAGSEKENKSE